MVIDLINRQLIPSQMPPTEAGSPQDAPQVTQGTQALTSDIIMPEGSQQLEIPFPSSPTQAGPAQDPCSFNECRSGHRWPAVMAVTRCPGCTGGVLAVQKTNCPFCNEPVIRTILRSDFLPRGAGVGARCQGAKLGGESLDVEMIRSEWQACEEHFTDFNERSEKEQEEKRTK